MIPIPIPSRLWLGIILMLIAACANSVKPSIKLSATPTALEDGQELTLSADIKGSQDPLKVEFFKGAQKVGEDATAPYELKLPITSSDDATLSFTAKVIAADSQSSVSEPVSVQVKVDKEAPKVSIVASSSNLNAAGAVTLTANATDNKGVVKVEFFKGADKLGDDTTPADGFSYVVNLSAEDNGSLKYMAKAYDAKGNVGISPEVRVVVDIDAMVPMVKLTSDKTSITIAGPATLTAEASDNKGVTKVEFFEGTNKLGEDTEAPYTYTLNFASSEAANGNHVYTAKAYDGHSNSAESGPITINIDIDLTAPTISLETDKTSVRKAGSVTLTAKAFDNKGIAKVEFYEGENKLGEDTEAPFTYKLDLTSASNGNHTYSAKAFDTTGYDTTSETLTIVVDIDATLPLVKLKSTKVSITAAGSATLIAEASDDKGIAKVEFYLQSTGGTIKLGEDSEAPYEYKLDFPFTEANNGQHSYMAKAYDGNSNSAESDLLTIGVDIDATSPGISLEVSPASLTAAGSLTLSASAGDNKGVVKVDFYRHSGGTASLLGSDTDGSDGYKQVMNYSVDYKATDSFSARAFDAAGNFKISDLVNISIDIDITSPTVSLGANPTKLSQPGTLTLTASSSDNQAVSKLEFYRVKTGGDELLKTITNPGPSVEHPLSLDGNDNGTVKFYAKAYDAKANSTTTAQLAVEVEIKPIITKFEAAQGSSLNLSDAGGTVDLMWDGNYVQNYILEVNPAVNTAIPTPGNTGNTSGRLTIPVNTTGSDITYTITLKAKSFGTPGFPDDVRTLNITVAKDTTSPTLSLSRNPTGDITAAGSVTLSASASDAAGVQKVEFYQGPTLLSTDTDGSDGYKHDLSFGATHNGNHSYHVSAYDTNGNTTNSIPVDVTVAIAPKINSLTSTSNSLSDAGKNITLNWTAQDHQGFSLSLDNTTGVSGMPSGTTTNTSAAITLPANTTGSAKTYTFTLTANPYGNVAADSKTVQVTVGPDTTPPGDVVLKSDTATLKEAGTVKLTTTATDAAGIQKVEFYKSGNATPIATDTTSPYEANTQTFSASDNGTHKYTAKVYDNNGNATDSAELSVVVNIVIWSKLAAGGQYSCALSLDGKTYCWGANDQNQLGNLTYTNTTTPTAASTLSGYSLSQVQAGFYHACALTSAGKAYCWGRNNESELGNGPGNTNNPVVDMPSNITFSQIGAGVWHSCALGSDGQVYCWGWNNYGQLGNGSLNAKVMPTLISMPSNVTFSKLAVGGYHTCALSTTGTAYCWGWNATSQLGSVGTYSATPIAVNGTFSQLVAGAEHSCGLTSSGQAYCWGNGGSGQIGDGSTSTFRRNSPTAVSMSGLSFSQLVGGNYHTCALTSGGVAYCWGWNTSGQVGNNSTSNQIAPVQVSMPQGLTFNQITAGGQHTCALTSDNKAYCWGRNEYGQIGTGDSANRLTPTLISQP